jgi:hypothetical protein
MSDNHCSFISISDDTIHNVYGLILMLLQLFWEQLHETSSVKADMLSSTLLYRDNNGNDYYFLIPILRFASVYFSIDTNVYVTLSTKKYVILWTQLCFKHCPFSYQMLKPMNKLTREIQWIIKIQKETILLHSFRVTANVLKLESTTCFEKSNEVIDQYFINLALCVGVWITLRPLYSGEENLLWAYTRRIES